MRFAQTAKSAGQVFEILKPRQLRTGFESAPHWVHITAAFFAFTSDVVKPLLPHCTWWVLALAITALFVLLIAVRLQKISMEIGSAIVVFCLITAILLFGVIGLQKYTGNDPEGIILSSVTALGEKLDNVLAELRTVKEDVGKVKEAITPKKDIYGLHLDEKSCTYIKAPSLYYLRKTVDVRPIDIMDNDRLITELEDGVYGFIPPWLLNNDKSGIINPQLTIGKEQIGTAELELQKARGDIFAVAFASEQDVNNISDKTRRDHYKIILFFKPLGMNIYPIAISLSCILDWRERSISSGSNSFYVSDAILR